MGRNRSRGRAGHRAARRPHRHAGNKTGATLNNQGKIAAINLVSATKTDATHVKLGFDRPIRAGTPSAPGATDVVMSGTSATTVHGLDATQNAASFVTVRTSGNLTAGKTYHVHINPPTGIIVPVEGEFGVKTVNFAS